MRINKKDIVYLVLFFILLFIVFLYGITKIKGFSIYPDEFGYWSSAAKAVGWDWSEVASLGSFYSYGYSLILTPLLVLFDNSVLAYKAAVAVNMLMMGIAFVLLVKIKQSLYEKESVWMDGLLGIIAIFYPSWIFYMQMTLTEALLMFLFVLLLFLCIRFVEKKSCLYAILFAATLGYLYMVHMRTVGVVIAGCMVMLFLLITRKEYRKSAGCFFVVLIVMGIVAVLLKSNTIQTVYSHADSSVIAINDYSGRWGIFKEFLTLQGIRDLCLSLLGKVFYLGCASLGLIYPAIYWLGKQILALFKKVFRKQGIENKEIVAFFLLLALLGEVSICAIGMYRPGKIDGLIYGRYSEFVMPVFMLIGIKQMLGDRKIFIKSGILAALMGVTVPILLFVIDSQGMQGIRGYHAVGMSYMLSEQYEVPARYFTESWCLFAGLLFLITIVVWLCKTKKHMEWILSCIVMIELVLGIQASNHYVYTSNYANHMDVVVSDLINAEYQEGEQILFVTDGRSPYIDFIQMQLREKSIHVIGMDELEGEIEQNDYLIIYTDMERICDYEDYFEERIFSNQYTLYYDTKEGNAGL